MRESMHSDRAQARLVAGLGSFVCLFGLMLAVQAAQTVPGTDIAGHWPLDTINTTPANTTADLSPNNNVATLVSGPTSTPGLFGNGLQFTSTSKRYLTVPDAASLDLGTTKSFTVAAWVKPTGTALMRVLNKWDGTAGFLLDINAASGGGNTAGHVRFYMRDAAGHVHDFAAAGALGQGAWKHVAGVCDRTSTTKRARIYVNGVEIVAARDITNLTGDLSNAVPLLIGAYNNAAHFNGTMDEPIYYSRALTAAEIKTLASVPQGLTATTNLTDRVTLNWTAVPGAVRYNILRSGTNNGPYTLVTTVNAPAVTYTDTTAFSPGPYYYVIQSVFTAAGGYTSTNSNQATGSSIPPAVTALPNTGLQTNENLAAVTFNIKFNQAAQAGGSLVVVSSSAVAEGVVSTAYRGVAGSYSTNGTGFQVTVPGGTSPTFAVTVTGVNDDFVDGPKAYTVSVSASGFTALTIPPVQLTNNDNDSPGVTINRTSGLVTTEVGGQDTFTVALNTQPYGPITMPISSSQAIEGTVSPTSITFTPANWQVAQPVIVTGQDDTVLDFTVPYTVVTGALVTTNTNDAPAYSGLNPIDVGVANVDNETIPPLDPVWGGGDGGGGGCGLTGLEAAMALGLALLIRRRRAATAS